MQTTIYLGKVLCAGNIRGSVESVKFICSFPTSKLQNWWVNSLHVVNAGKHTPHTHTHTRTRTHAHTHTHTHTRSLLHNTPWYMLVHNHVSHIDDDLCCGDNNTRTYLINVLM